MTASLPDADVVLVSAKEYGKLSYLLTVIKLMDRMYQDFKKWRETVAFSDGVTVDTRIDWRSVVNFCAPDVLVVLTHDKSGKEFEDFPLYAVLPRSGQYFELKPEMSVSIEESEDGKPEFDVVGTLNSLLSYVETIDGGKKENAMKQLHILKRILR